MKIRSWILAAVLVAGLIVVVLIRSPFQASATSTVGTGSSLCPYPQGGTYSIQGKSTTTLQGTCVFGPTVPGVTFGEIGSGGGMGGIVLAKFDPGTSGNYIYYYPYLGSNAQGPVGRWDISNPLSPKGPDKIELTSAPGCNKGSGPIVMISCGHDSGPQTLSAADFQDGSARAFYILITQQEGIQNDTGAMSIAWDGKGSGRFGQQVERNEAMSTWLPGSVGNVVTDATETGKFFAYVPNGSPTIGLPGSTKVSIFDISDPTGSPQPPFITTSSSIPWSRVAQMKVLRVPGLDNHFLLARSFPANGSATVRLAELDADTGLPVRSKIQTLSVGARTTDLQFGAQSTIKSAVVNGTMYVFMVDSLPFGQSVYLSGGGATMVVGVYKFDPAALTLTKISSLSFNNVNDSSVGGIELAADPNGGAYPVLITHVNDDGLWRLVGDTTAPGSIPRAGSQGEILRFYATKPFFTAGTYTPSPDFTFTIDPYHWPFAVGDLVSVQTPYAAALKTENGKVNLYLYRAYFTHQGERDFFDDPHALIPGPTRIDDSYGVDYEKRGSLGLRVDQVDVTSLASLGPVAPNPSFPPNPTSGSGVNSNHISCDQVSRVLCDQFEQLKNLVCRLNPGAAVCAAQF